MIIENIPDYINALENESDGAMYRGQADKSWSLIPSIGRLYNKLENYNTLFGDWESLEKELLSKFKSHSAPYMNFSPSTKLEWLIHAQHHGLPTTLMDWTTNPLVALYFSVSDPEKDYLDGVVYRITPKSWRVDSEDIDRIQSLIAFYPKHLNSRVVAQSACFTAFPYPDNLKPMSSLSEPKSYTSTEVYQREKMIIPKGLKSKLRKELNKLGINHLTMFPSIDSVAKHIVSGFNI